MGRGGGWGGGLCIPYLSTAIPVPPLWCPHPPSASVGTPQKWGHHKIPPSNTPEISPACPPIQYHSPSFQGDSHCRTQSVRVGCISRTPKAALPLGWGIAAVLGSPGCGHGAAALCRSRHGRGWALLTSCPCQEHKAPDEAGPGQAGLSGSSVCVPASPGCFPLGWNSAWG